MNKIILIVALAFSINSYAQQEGEKKSAKEVFDKIMGDKKMPDITLSDINGEKVNLSEVHKGTNLTVISFWATWCVPCKKELNNISEMYKEWQEKYKMKLVAVSIDDSRSAVKVKPYVDGQSWDYTVLLDPNSDLKRAMNIQNVPFTFVLDKDGNVIHTHSGYVEGDEFGLEDILIKYSK